MNGILSTTKWKGKCVLQQSFSNDSQTSEKCVFKSVQEVYRGKRGINFEMSTPIHWPLIAKVLMS